MEAELQSQIPGLDHVISEYSVVSASINLAIDTGYGNLMDYRAT
jgi:hypothetical protein